MKAMHDFIDPRTAEFIGLPATLDTIRPSSEAARRKLVNPDIFEPKDAPVLVQHHERVRIAMEMMSTQPEVADHLRHHLRQLPWLGEVWEQTWGQAELALLQLFRYHLHRLRERLTHAPVLAAWCDLPEAVTLDDGILGDPARRSFSLDVSQDPELSILRETLQEFSTEAREEEEALREQIADDYDLSTDTPQWVIDRGDRDRHESMSDDDRLLITAESIASVRFAPRPSRRLIALRRDLDAALIRERALETRLIAQMERVLRTRQDLWRHVERRLVRLDLLLAMAQRATETRAVAPRLITGDCAYVLDLAGGIHDGLKRWVEDHNQEYTPLTLSFERSVATLTGANMGGKTVALQTVGWLQAMTQLGFYVPAQHFATRLYHRVAALSTYRESVGGLSGFGREINRLREILPWRINSVLYLVDEPGRTTHVEEGRALTRAVLDAIMQSPSTALVSTHLDGLEDPEIELLRMGGLRRDLLATWRDAPESERLPLHRLMRYTVEKVAPGQRRTRDALDVAEMLGLEPGIIERARAYMETEPE